MTATYLGLGIDPETHDLALTDAEGGNLVMVADAEAVGHLVKQRLMTYRGEWFLDDQVGVPWFHEVLVRPFNEIVAESIIKATVVETLGVTALRSFEMEARIGNRELAVLRIEATTQFDEAIEVNL